MVLTMTDTTETTAATEDPADLIAVWERRWARERRAREEAEALLESKSLALYRARHIAEQDRQRLSDAIDVMRDGFAVLGDKMEVLFWNRALVKHLYLEDDTDVSGMLLADLISAFGIKRIRYENGKPAANGADALQVLESSGGLELELSDHRVLVVKLEPDARTGRPLTIRDVTMRRRMEDQLLDAHKHEALGTLAGGIAHEINTPTQYISDNLGFLRDSFQDLIGAIDTYEAAIAGQDALKELTAEVNEEFDLDFVREEAPGAVSQALMGAEQIAKIVSAVRLYSHPSTEISEAADVGALLESAAMISRNEWKYVAKLDIDIAEGMPPVPLRIDGMRQVILNLIVNAAQAIGGGSVNPDGTNPKDARPQDPDANRISLSSWLEEDHVVVTVDDTGPGVPEALHDKVFDPFFTTKAPGEGTGQGLSICRRIVVEDHGGAFEITSAPQGGARFVIRLPLNPDREE